MPSAPAPVRLATPPAEVPSVGIFWLVADAGASSAILVTDRTTLAAAEPYGEFLTHPRGHYEVWVAWRALGPAGLQPRGLPPAIAWHEYEHFPRGRIVHHLPSRSFILYADRRLHSAPVIDSITEAFALAPNNFVVRGDPHYRTD